jgi:hypothetical protein
MSRSIDEPVKAVRNRRVDRLMKSAIAAMDLDLTDVGVLTEAASGHFEATCLMAALAGASPVVAVAKDSEWGRADEVISGVRSHAESLGVGDHLRFVSDISSSDIRDCSLVTNLGFVRPLGTETISALPKDAGISLMCEPWEFRSDDVDVGSAIKRRVPVAGTNEMHPLVRTFDYLGPLTGQLLTNSGVEVIGSTLLIVGSRQFAGPMQAWLKAAGADRVDVAISPLSGSTHSYPFGSLDALVVADMGRDTLGFDGLVEELPSLLAQTGTTMVVVAGDLDPEPLLAAGVPLNPQDRRMPGHMWVTTSAVGPKPVIDLHCAGLRVGELLVRARRAGSSPEEAVDSAVESGFGLIASTS